MALTKRPAAERFLVYVFLIVGSIVFVLPFLWMVLTSFKLTREMTLGQTQFLPRTPTPRDLTPYIDDEQFTAPILPDGVTQEVWDSARRDLDEGVSARVNAWVLATPGREGNAPPGITADEPKAEIWQGAYDVISRRVSDEARKEGAARLVKEGIALLDDETLRTTFDNCYRRICLGDVRVRTRDYVSHTLYSGKEWTTEDEGAALVQRDDSLPNVQEARINYRKGSPSKTFVLSAAAPAFDSTKVDRVFVSFRSDATWAAIQFEVIRSGVLYRTTDAIFAQERDWLEQELRWPEDDRDPLARRIYSVLEEAGPAPLDSPPFEVRVRVTRSSGSQAWMAKAANNYRQTFREVPYSRYIATSFSLSILNIVLSIFSCTLVAYGFARLEWPGRDFFFLLLLATMMLPPQVTMIPSFLVIKSLGWYNTLLPLWVPAAFGAPFYIFLLRQFFKNIPTDLEDAARIDGCGFLRVYWHVMFPLVKPVIATIAIFTFMGTWNNFMGPLIYVNDERLFPLALGLFKFLLTSASSGDNIVLIMAASLMMTLPIIVLFFCLQRYFIQGITLTGSKG